jgi:hypothetical protein
MKKKKLDIDKLINSATIGTSRWELDNIVYHDRTSNPATLLEFLKRIQFLETLENPSLADKNELIVLRELANDLDPAECEELLTNNDDLAQQQFIENLARQGALETLCKNEISIATMSTMCKLSPNDFILTAKRSQDIINAIQELVIQGETLSKDVAGA